MKLGTITRRIRLGDIAIISAGQGAPQGETSYSSNGIPFIKAGNLQDLASGTSEDSIQCVNEIVALRYKLKLYKKGSVLFAKSGMSCMKGLVHVLRRDCYVVSHLAIVTPTENLSSKYLKHYFNFHKPNELIKDSAYPSISLADIANIELHLPLLDEQEKIARTLDAITSLLSLRRQQLDKLQQLAKSQFVEMFGECQNMKPLSDCGEIYTGATPSMSHPEYYDSDDICFLKPSDLSFDVKKITSSEYHVSNKASSVIRFFPPGAVLVTCIGATIGKLGISMIQGTCNQQINFIIPKENCSAEYIAYALIIRKEDLMDAANSTAVPILNKTQFSNFRIPIPDTQEQTQFASFISHLDKSKFAVESSIAKLEVLYRSKLQEYFG